MSTKYRTAGTNPYAVKFSPFFDFRLAVASSANFGLVGNGRLTILGISANGSVRNENVFDTQDGLFDVAWSETHENQLVGAGGDGSIKLFDIALNEFPIRSWQEHKKEVFSVHWNLVEKSTFCSSSWDGSIKIWSPSQRSSLATFAPGGCVYAAVYCPHHPSILASVSSDSTLRTWDPRSPSPNVQTIIAHPKSEVLTLDWNKYREGLIATGGVDRSIRLWDLRQPKEPRETLWGHNYAVRKLAWSPFSATSLLTSSYDMTCRLWETSDMNQTGPSSVGHMAGVFDRHTEFCVGLDWSLFGDGFFVATCGWDEAVW